MSFRATQFTSAIDLLKAVNVGYPWISDAKEKNDVLYQAKKLLNMARNCRAFYHYNW